MAFNGNALIEAVKDNLGIIKISGIGFVFCIVLMVLLGILLQNVSDGTITTSSAANTSIQALGTTAFAALTTMAGVFASIAGFVLITALMKAFGIDMSFGGSRK